MRTEGIVLHTTRHSDTTSVVHVFTRRCGPVAVVVKRSARQRGHGVSAALVQPLTQITFECDHAAEGLQTLRGAEIDGVYASVPFVPEKSAVAMFLAEFLWHALRTEQASESLYEFLALSLRWFDEAEDGYANFHLLFLLQLTRYLGYDPSLLPEARQYDMDTLMRHSYRTMRLIPLNGVQRSMFLTRIVDFYREVIPGFPQIKSLEILTQMYNI